MDIGPVIVSLLASIAFTPALVLAGKTDKVSRWILAFFWVFTGLLYLIYVLS